MSTFFINNVKDCDSAAEGMWPQTGEGVPVPIKPVSAAGGHFFSISCLCPQWQVLNKAKNHIQELEQTLDNLLKVKESFNLEDGHANSLEEVREEYASIHSRKPR